MKSTYRFLEHTADIKIEAIGKNFLDALKQAFFAIRYFYTSKKNFKNIRTNKEFDIKALADSKEELIYKIFSQLIAKIEIEQAIPIKIKIVEYKELKNRLKIKLKIKATNKIKQKDQIKAVTYHDLQVKQEDKKTILTILFDV
jgi:SHS2 domain-containing protein